LKGTSKITVIPNTYTDVDDYENIKKVITYNGSETNYDENQLLKMYIMTILVIKIGNL